MAPADVERGTAPAALRGFAPVPMEPLPFRSILIGSSNDRAASPARAGHFADEWGSDFTSSCWKAWGISTWLPATIAGTTAAVICGA